MDRRVSPARIVKVLREINADILALQEVLNLAGASPEEEQARFIAGELEYHYCIGENRKLRGGAYGNVVLSRLPISTARNYDISWHSREQRGCLRADIHLPDKHVLHVFNVHLGTSYMERRHQGRTLVTPEILNDPGLLGKRVLLGDFNEWTRGLTSQLLASHLVSADIRVHLQRRRTYPGLFPVFHLDHIYFDESLELKSLTLHRSRTALIASDHLPLVADFHSYEPS
jgi:endonuclease/exonuclease/phosphatase family metal-dependent hydrolase